MVQLSACVAAGALLLSLSLPTPAAASLEGAGYERRRRALEGVSLPDKWVVRAQPGSCDDVVDAAQRFADEERSFMMSAFLFMSGRSAGPAARAAPIGAACFATVSASEGVRDKLAKLPYVLDITPDERVFADSVVPWHLDRIDQSATLLDAAPYSAMYTGAGVTVYMCDSGLDADHAEFAGGRGVQGPLFSSTTDHGGDGTGHGTHVAGIVAGLHNGVAPGARVVSLKVLDDAGQGSMGNIVQAMSWAVEQQRALSPDGLTVVPAVITMSLSGGASSGMNSAVREVSALGMIVTMSSGNNGYDAALRSPAGAGGDGRNYGPITVGASREQDRLASWSNWGDVVDITAPGYKIIAAQAGGGFTSKSGTSMSTPVVAGVAATLLQKHSHNREAAIDELFRIATPGVIDFKDSNAKDSDLVTPNLMVHVPTELLGDADAGEPGFKVSTRAPSQSPTESPESSAPTRSPTRKPTAKPTQFPTDAPVSSRPTLMPSRSPSQKPSGAPSTRQPTQKPSTGPTAKPSSRPSPGPTAKPSSRAPSVRPSANPSQTPTTRPSQSPTTSRPTTAPSLRPTQRPSTGRPTPAPPTDRPTPPLPTVRPTVSLGCEQLAANHNSEAQRAGVLTRDGSAVRLQLPDVYMFYVGPWEGASTVDETMARRGDNWGCNFKFGLRKYRNRQGRFFRSSNRFSPRTVAAFGSTDLETIEVRVEEGEVRVLLITDTGMELLSAATIPGQCALPLALDIVAAEENGLLPTVCNMA